MLGLFQELLRERHASAAVPSPTGRVAVLPRRLPGRARSPELRFLVEMLVDEARRAFRDARAVGDPLAHLGDSDYALLLDDEDAIVIGRSLAEMRDTLDHHAPCTVMPRRLDRIVPAREAACFTLRDLQRVERRYLPEAPPAPDRPGDREAIAPVRLVRTRDLVDRAGSLASWLHGESTAAELLGDLPLYRAGLCLPLDDYYGHQRREVLGLVPDDARTVLDVGCAKGRTGGLLRDRGLRVTGVEIHEEAATQARRRLDTVIVGDVMDVDLPGPFDVVLALDVVEHLADADAFLARVPELLEPGGTLIVSVPNVGHYSVVADLAAGRWDYVPMGQLCCTHLRFFTARTLTDHLRRAGLHDVRVIRQKTPIPPRLRRDLGRLEGADLESLATAGLVATATHR